MHLDKWMKAENVVLKWKKEKNTMKRDTVDIKSGN